jgi:glucuronoarabinoxylan endo-1,4-beta-xylanase
MKDSIRRLLGLIICFLIFWYNIDAQTATITLTSEKQLIRGYGGINHPVWVGDLTAAQRETAFGNGDGQIGMSVLRIWVSDDSTQWPLELPTAQRAIALGAIVFASPWNPPSTMRESFGTTAAGLTKYRLKYSSYAAYASHLNNFVTYMKNNGVNLYAISIQNEPDYADTWTWWTATELVNFLKNNASAINCKIIAPESFQYVKAMSDPILNDSAALANMDILGAHLYGTSYANFPYPLFKQKGAGKELWMTEVYYPNSTANSSDNWPEALETGQHIHSAMVDAEFQTYVWWTIRRSYGPMKEDGTIGKRGYIMSHFCKFVRPGYVRVDATSTPTTNVYLSAYKKGDNVVIVAVNKNTTAQTLTLTIPGTKVTSWDRYTTTGSKSLLKETSINNTTGTFQVTLEAESMNTFNGIAPITTVVTPTVTITAPANNANLCSGTAVVITASATISSGSISKIEFYDGTALLGTATTSPYSYNWTNPSVGTHTIAVIATSAAGVASTKLTETITVNALPTISAGTAVTICNGSSTVLTATGGTSFKWSNAISTNTNTVSPSTTTTYSVTGTNTSSCNATSSVMVTVNTVPSPSVTTPVSYFVGATSSALSATGTALKWYTIATGGTALSTAPSPSTTTIGTVNYYVSQTVNTCESQRATISVVVSSRTIALKTGWNYIGCPITGSTALQSALSSIWTNVETVKNLDSFYSIVNPAALNSLKTVEWGKGYLVKITTPCVLDWIAR